MPGCEVTDRVVTFSNLNAGVAVEGQIVKAYPNIDGSYLFVSDDGGTTWYLVQHPGERTATTSATGYYTQKLPKNSEQDPADTTWTIQFVDGTQAVGIPPDSAGPFTIRTLKQAGWTISEI